MEKVLLQAHVLPKTKAKAMLAARSQGLSLSAWMQTVTDAAIEAHEAKQARKAAANNYNEVAPL